MSRYWRSLLLAFLAVFSPTPGWPQELPIFDAHIHYSQPDWSVYPPEAALAILDRAGIRWAMVSSTPDDGTLRLFDKAPDRVVPILRPYRTRNDMGTWTGDPSILSYVESRLRRGIYRGIGEFHLAVGEAGSAVVRGFVQLATRHGIFLHAHTDDVAVEELLRLDPKVRVLWAHAGMSAGADTVGRLLDRYPNLSVELALRSDVAPGGQLDPAWQSLFLRHPERFMVGTDTWVTSQWDRLPDIQAGIRGWLRQLPREVAEQFAFKNAARLTGKHY
ncbi:MAG: amidohydrolase family protein [candidate division NC10 bacterium]|nr:amidohydrolase family protein [candidate division NC10 bacterium]